MTSDGAVSFGDDQYNRLTSAGSATFNYDALGRLYQSTGASGTARRQYDDADMIAVCDSADALTERGARPGLEPGSTAPAWMNRWWNTPVQGLRTGPSYTPMRAAFYGRNAPPGAFH